MKVSDYIISFFKAQGVKHIFGYPGGSVLHLLGSLHNNDYVQYVQTYHEQSAAFCADSYARATQSVGVAMATSGPGSTNIITGIANAFFDSIPCIFLTGQVSVHAMKKNTYVRQRGFQETDIVSLVKPITKFSCTILDADKIDYYLKKAWQLATTGRQGPVLLDIPHNIQASIVDKVLPEPYIPYNAELSNDFDARVMVDIAEKLAKAQRPLLLVGGGMRSDEAKKILRNFSTKHALPVVTSLQGLDVPEHNERFIGFLGSYGSRAANISLAATDLLIVLGSRLDERQIGSKPLEFAQCATKIHVDIDYHELGHTITSDIALHGDAVNFLGSLNQHLKTTKMNTANWLAKLADLKKRFSFQNEAQTSCPQEIHPNIFLQKLSELASANTIFCLDVGQNQMWSAQSISFQSQRRIISSSGHGAMGFALPAAIGAAYASPKKQIICVCGDGGLNMNIQELQCLSRDKLSIKIVLLNNESLGMVREFQTRYFDDNCLGSIQGYQNPCYEKISSAYKIDYLKIDSLTEVSKMKKFLDSSEPCLIEVKLPQKFDLYPCPAPGYPMENQFPLLDDGELKNILTELTN